MKFFFLRFLSVFLYFYIFFVEEEAAEQPEQLVDKALTEVVAPNNLPFVVGSSSQGTSTTVSSIKPKYRLFFRSCLGYMIKFISPFRASQLSKLTPSSKRKRKWNIIS